MPSDSHLYNHSIFNLVANELTWHSVVNKTYVDFVN